MWSCALDVVARFGVARCGLAWFGSVGRCVVAAAAFAVIVAVAV